jgi:DedD protein
MREPNPRLRLPRERFELSLDGRQVASIVAGALVLLAVVFVLGLNVGKQIAQRRAEREPAGDLDALDRAPAPPAPVKDEALTFHDRLTKDAPAPLPPAPPEAPAQRAASATVTPTPTPPPTASPTASPTAPPTSAGAAPRPDRPAAPPSGSRSPPAKPWTVQLAAAQEHAEAERIAGKFSALNPRIEEADVPGKGRFWRVRVGGFDTKDAAERYLRDIARETGAKGFVTPTR